MRVGMEASQVREGPELQGLAPPPWVPLPALACLQENSLPWRRSDGGQRGCCCGNAQTASLSLILGSGVTITQCVDKEVQSVALLQGKRCAGPGPALPTPESK